MIPKSSNNVELQEFLAPFEHAGKTIQQLKTEIDQLKVIIRNKSKYKNQFDEKSLQEKCLKLKKEREKLIHYQNTLKTFLEDNTVPGELAEVGEKFRKNEKVLNEISTLHSFLAATQEIETLQKASKDLFSKGEYYESYKNMINSCDLYEQLNFQGESLKRMLAESSNLPKDIDIVVKKLNSDVSFYREEFIYNSIQLFRSNVLFKEENGQANKIFHFDFLKSMSSEQYESYIGTILEERNDFVIHFKNTLDNLTSHYIKPILEENKISSLMTNDLDQSKSIQLVTSAADNSQMKNLLEFIEIVLNLFTLNQTIEYSSKLIKFIGELWSEQIFTEVINCYFEQSIPKSETEFENFLTLLKKGNDLEDKLQNIGLIETASNVLKEYSQNIQNHFSTKLCQDFIIRMKQLLKPPKHTYSSEEILSKCTLVRKSKFAECQISDYMVDCMQLIQEMSALLLSSSSNLSIQLIETAYLACELFIIIAPYKFKELIESDCKENAIFHNNCLFFGHLIESFMLTHRPQLDNLCTMMPSIRNIASQIFFTQMRYQEKTLSSYIGKSNETFYQSLEQIANEIPSTDLRISSQSHFEFRECLNNCLKHLSHLHISFSSDNGKTMILSKKIVNKVFATLLSVLFQQFIDAILSLNDISSLGSSHLYSEIDYFTKEIKLFLVDSDEVIFKWMKLNEINFLLKSSLLEILNRWADGQGILATYLKPEEVKHLIKALFQNNERRANVLAKIK